MSKKHLAAWLVWSLPGVAYANDTADQLFREARASVTTGDYATACPKFAESQRLEPAPGTLMNLADCEEHIGAIVRARDDFALAASGFPRDDPRRAFALKHAGELEQRFAHLVLRLDPRAPSDLTLRRANAIVDRSTLGTAVAVDPGEQRIVVTAPGRVDRYYTVRLADGESKDLTVDAGEVAPTKTIVKTLVVQQSNPRRTAGLILGGVGLASVVVGIASGVVAIGDANAVRAHCTPAYSCDPIGFSAASEGNIASPLSTVTIIAGAAFAVAGVVLFVTSFGHARATISPTAGPTTAGFTFATSF